MARSAAPVSATTERWLSIRKAADLLGVNQATLRQWADNGKVRTFTTPGGHRRFAEQDLLTLLESRPPAARGPSLAELLLASRERYESLARRSTTVNQWYEAFDDPARRRFRILGGSMLTLIGTYLTAGRRERERSLAEGKDVAVEYGTEAARLGLSLPQATEAFLLFRTPVLESVRRWIRERQPTRREADELLRRAGEFMDQVLVSMASAHEAARIGSTSEVNR